MRGRGRPLPPGGWAAAPPVASRGTPAGRKGIEGMRGRSDRCCTWPTNRPRAARVKVSGSPQAPGFRMIATANPDPMAIATALSRRVMGQEQAVREMAIALAKQLAGLRVGNILMIERE